MGPRLGVVALVRHGAVALDAVQGTQEGEVGLPQPVGLDRIETVGIEHGHPVEPAGRPLALIGQEGGQTVGRDTRGRGRRSGVGGGLDAGVEDGQVQHQHGNQQSG